MISLANRARSIGPIALATFVYQHDVVMSVAQRSELDAFLVQHGWQKQLHVSIPPILWARKVSPLHLTLTFLFDDTFCTKLWSFYRISNSTASATCLA
jgi:hypothetical protein